MVNFNESSMGEAGFTCSLLETKGVSSLLNDSFLFRLDAVGNRQIDRSDITISSKLQSRQISSA